MAAKTEAQDSGALNVSLHPLVLLTISDHFTRAKITNAGPRVLGGVIGIMRGREIEICNCFEIVCQTQGDKLVSCDMEVLRKRQEQFLKVYEDYEFLGWYTNGKEPTENDLVIHKQMCTLNENPLLLMVDTEGAYSPANKDLPVKIFESQIHVTPEGITMNLVQVPFRIATAEAERIGVDHVTQVTPSGSGAATQLISQLTSARGTVMMLSTRIKALLSYVEAVRSGKVPFDHDIMRQVKSLCNLLPTVDTPDFRARFLDQQNDAMLITLLSALTKSANTMNELLNKHQATVERSFSSRRGLLFS